MTHGLNWRSFWTALAERSGDSAFVETTQAAAQSKAAWRSASRRTPKREI